MTGPEDAFLESLDHLVEVLDSSEEVRRFVRKRTAHLRREREKGRPYRQIVTEEQPPLIVEQMRSFQSALTEAIGRMQRAEARALYDEGLTMEQIARLFGVSRQRIADLLRSDRR